MNVKNEIRKREQLIQSQKSALDQFCNRNIPIGEKSANSGELDYTNMVGESIELEHVVIKSVELIKKFG